MFAIFLNKNMDPFYQNISSLPTALFSVLLIVCLFYWAGAVLGLIDIDILNVDTDIDLNADSEHSTPDVLAGLLIKFKLVNHTLAMMRDNIKRFARRTWCTTKKVSALEDVIAIYMHYHNTTLIPPLTVSLEEKTV